VGAQGQLPPRISEEDRVVDANKGCASEWWVEKQGRLLVALTCRAKREGCVYAEHPVARSELGMAERGAPSSQSDIRTVRRRRRIVETGRIPQLIGK
jgi:hypothetical protein